MMSLQIKDADNGFVLSWDEEAGDSYKDHRLVVTADTEDEFGELVAMRKLLHLVKEHFGIFQSKHNKKNLYIEIR